MVRLVLAAALLGACYQPELADCADKCDTTGLCPDGLSCDGKFCRAEGASGTCTEMQDASAVVDAPSSCPQVPVAQGCTPMGPMPTPPLCIAACAAKPGTMAVAFAVGTWHAVVLDGPNKVAAAMTAANGATAWIGLTQMPGAGTPAAGWSWVNGMPLVSPSWATTQPDDGDGTENNTEQCASMTGATWSDEDCSVSHVFLISAY